MIKKTWIKLFINSLMRIDNVDFTTASFAAAKAARKLYGVLAPHKAADKWRKAAGYKNHVYRGDLKC